MRLLDPTWLHALWAVPTAAGMLVLARWLGSRSLRRLIGPALVEKLVPGASSPRRLARAAVLLTALAAAVLALARPGWSPTPQKVQRSGRDVAILMDVSRSMLAQDLKPSRLERAKIAVRDLLDAARGDRVGIIAFAGSASIRCPLTTDYSFARLALDNLSPDSVPVGGTLIGDAIRAGLDDLFKDGQDRFRDIVLITDGEDHDSFPVQAAAEAGKRGVRIIAIGLGSDTAGAPVPAPEKSAAGPYMTFEGQAVRSKLDSDSLRKIAAASRDGIYLNVRTGNIQFDKIYRTLMERAATQEVETTERLRYHEGFQLFLGAALALLMLEALISERRRIP